MQRSWRRLGLWLLLGFLGTSLRSISFLAIARYLLPNGCRVMCGFAATPTRGLPALTPARASFTRRLRLLAGSLLAALLLFLAFAAPWIDGYCRS
jgi:hypothetical protein